VPYANEIVGIYRVVDKAAEACYVGQSRRIKKRVADHFNLLRQGIHPNKNMQESFSKNGEKSFYWEVEVACSDPNDLDRIEELFLQGEAVFVEHGKLFNISSTAKRPMAGRKHSAETKRRLSEVKKGDVRHVTEHYKKKLSNAQRQRHLSNPEFVCKLTYILGNEHLSYAARGRFLGMSTGSVRKLALKYQYLKEQLK
jgi:group I intron endonuclease